MSHVFHSPFKNYVSFVFSGLIFWEFIVSTAVTGCNALINAEGYIRQFAHPLQIYSLRSTLACFINLGFASLGLFAWIIFETPSHFNLSWSSLPLSFALLLFIGWPLATIAALTTVLFRDFSQMITLILQVLWYVSPIFILPEIFENAQIGWILELNPVSHLISLFRAPLLHGSFPLLFNYAFVLSSSIVLWIIALLFLKSFEKKVLFYL